MVHPENIVLAMLGDQDCDVRSEAVALIKAARQRHQPGPVRKFKCPGLNLSATTYRNMEDVKK